MAKIDVIMPQMGESIAEGTLSRWLAAQDLPSSVYAFPPLGVQPLRDAYRFLIDRLGGHATKVRPRKGDPMGLELISSFSRGNFHVRGFSGNGKLDHCAHLGLYRDVLRVHVKPRWKSPRGMR